MLSRQHLCTMYLILLKKHIIDGPACTELDRSGIGRNKEQSARILGHLVANSPTLIRPYVEPIVNVLIPKLKETETNPMVITSVLSAIGMYILKLYSCHVTEKITS